MKKLSLLCLATLTLSGCTKTPENRVIKKATYQWDSLRQTRGGYESFFDRINPPAWQIKPNGADTTIHLEVSQSPYGAYGLGGWVDSVWPGHHVHQKINGGEVDKNGIPVSVSWNTDKMGEPLVVWKFYFTGADLPGGGMVLEDRGVANRYHEIE